MAPQHRAHDTTGAFQNCNIYMCQPPPAQNAQAAQNAPMALPFQSPVAAAPAAVQQPPQMQQPPQYAQQMPYYLPR